MNSVLFQTFSYYIVDTLLSFIGIKNPWNIMHVFFNTNITYICAPYVYSFCKYYIYNGLLYSDDINNTGLSVLDNVLAFHLYHYIKYFKYLSISDMFHHLTVLLYYIFLNKYYAGYILFILVFALIGPGGLITYSLLSLSDANIISKHTSIRLTKYANIYIRMPLCLITSFCGYISLFNSNYSYSSIFFIGSFILISTIAYNGLFYAEQSIKIDILKNN